MVMEGTRYIGRPQKTLTQKATEDHKEHQQTTNTLVSTPAEKKKLLDVVSAVVSSTFLSEKVKKTPR